MKRFLTDIRHFAFWVFVLIVCAMPMAVAFYNATAGFGE